MKEELYAHRRINETDEDATYIGIFFEGGTLVARKQDNVPNSRFPIFYHPHLREGADFENHCPIVAKGAAAYYLYCVEEEMGIRAYRAIEKVGYINKEQSQISYRNFCWLEHFKSEEMQQIWQMIKGAGKVEDYYSKTFLPQFIKEEKGLLSESKKLRHLNKDIIKEAEDFLSSLAESEDEQANEPPYLFAPRGIDFSKILSLLKEEELVDETLSFLDFLAQIRNGRLDCIKNKTHKKIVIKEVGKKMGNDWVEMVLENEGIQKKLLDNMNTSTGDYNSFRLSVASILGISAKKM